MPGKDALIDELIDLFVADLPRRLGAITQAIERADAPALALQAHALRGGAANFGAGRLDELCGKLEEIGVRGTLAEAAAMLDELSAKARGCATRCWRLGRNIPLRRRARAAALRSPAAARESCDR